MRVLLLGSGGREHAMAWKIAQKFHFRRIVHCPRERRNKGTWEKMLHFLQPTVKAIKKFVLAENIDMVVVGPEDPLVSVESLISF